MILARLFHLERRHGGILFVIVAGTVTKTSIEDRKLVSSELLAAKDRPSSNDEGMK